MSIARLLHVSLCGLLVDKEQTLRDLQALGVAHLVRDDGRDARPGHGPGSAPQSRRALRFLEGARHRWHQSHDWAAFDAAATEARALEIEARLRELAEELHVLRARIRELTPWGDFAFPPGDPVGGRFWFYIVPNHRMRSMPADGTCWLVVHRDSRLSYVVVVADEEPVGIPAERTHAGARALSRLRERQEAVQIEIDEFEAQRARESRWCDLFGASLDRLEDAAARRAACGATHDDAPFFCITAWIAESSAQSVRQFAASRSLACLLRPPVAGEDPPTLLQNRGIAAFGEDLLRFYLVPGYGGWDPSRSIFWFFAAFVAVILADAGYAAVLAVGLAFLWRRLGRSAAGARGRSLAAAAVLASLAWGVLVGSYFGVAAEPGSLAARAALVPMGDPSAYVTLALSLGAAQIAFANLASAWHFGGRDAIARLGWVALIGGGLSLWFSRPPATDLLSAPGAWACLAGWAAIAVFSGGRRGVARRVADGALGIARTVGLFGDVLSYLRLFALAFAGASLASAFNELASRAASGAPGVGLLAGLAILVVGHAANLGLGVASALVHGLRLNLIEYLNWSIVGEGRPFQQFSCKEKQPWSSH